jgi:hypothetical protein
VIAGAIPQRASDTPSAVRALTEPAPDWAGAAPLADHRKADHGLWRLIGGLNARTGRVSHLDNYLLEHQPSSGPAKGPGKWRKSQKLVDIG